MSSITSHTPAEPPVSIGLPVYNGERYLAGALDSILAQRYTDFELIVSDNGSTDGTEGLCRDYAARDGRIRYHREAVNQGAAWNFNHTVHLARGQYFRWACHDDRLDPAHLARCVETFAAAPPSVILVHTGTRFIDEDDAPIGSRPDGLALESSRPHQRLAQVLRHLHFSNAIYGLLRTDALRRTQLLGRYPSADLVLFTELSLLGEFREIPEYLFFRRFHAGMSRRANVSNDDVAKWFDPNLSQRFHFPETRVLFEHFRAIQRSALDPIEKTLAMSTVVQHWIPRRARLLAREYASFVSPALVHAWQQRHASDVTPDVA